jgi:hypothetical protein
MACLTFLSFGQSNQAQATEEKAASTLPIPDASTSVTTPAPKIASPRVGPGHSDRERLTYSLRWGIDKLEVREAASGSLLRFSYRVTNAEKAKLVNDKKSTPYLIDRKTGAVLVVPTMPKVGALRQTSTPQNGLDYWMAFSNKGNFVKPGNRVDIVIGTVRVTGLVVVK